jgi:hypothetical protein
MTRIPEPGEVWRSAWGSTVTIVCADAGWVGYSDATGNRYWLTALAFQRDYRPPTPRYTLTDIDRPPCHGCGTEAEHLLHDAQNICAAPVPYCWPCGQRALDGGA